jgi:2-keto-4-pentenoate hydratase/2-oxohepta-3-ene-1,7-dioic acid hydratase in catechol pathway
MQLGTVRTSTGLTPAVLLPEGGAVPTAALLGRPTGDLMSHLVLDELAELESAARRWDRSRGVIEQPDLVAPFRHPRKILGIGLNYGAHARDLHEQAPRTSPASFIKGDHTIIGTGEQILLPPEVGRVTAEAELGLVFGRRCSHVGEADALDYIAGACAILDQTAEEVLLENPRYLTRVKNYPTFLSLGPVIVTMDEVLATVGTLDTLEVRTVHNGRIYRSDRVKNMTFSPAELISFHSHVMPFDPGDILLTGTPGAVAISAGDVVRCDLVGLTSLTNEVGDAPPV